MQLVEVAAWLLFDVGIPNISRGIESVDSTLFSPTMFQSSSRAGSQNKIEQEWKTLGNSKVNDILICLDMF